MYIKNKMYKLTSQSVLAHGTLKKLQNLLRNPFLSITSQI